MILRFIIAIILLVLVCGGIVGFNYVRDEGTKADFAGMVPPPVTVSTVKVTPIDWKPGIEAIGTVGASSGVDLTVETSGVVKTINFGPNQKVKAGDVLVQLDDEMQRADLESAETQKKLNQQVLDRARQLQKRGVGTDSTLDTALAAFETAQAIIARLRAVLDQKRLEAPFGGVMGIPKIDLGQYIQPGTVVATLQNLDTMRADFSVPEQELSKLRIGQQVTLGLDGSAEGFAGTISGIEPKIDPSSRLVTVRALVSNSNDRLRPGQFVQVRVELPEEKNIVAVPQTALTSSLYGDFVFVVRPAPPKPAETAPAKPAETAKPDEAAKPAENAAQKPAEAAKPALVLAQVFVKPGRRRDGLVEIVEGIKAGDEIVTAGQNRLANGMSAVVDNTVDPSKPVDLKASAQ